MKDDGASAQRLTWLQGKQCRLRVWWTKEAQETSPHGDVFEATYETTLGVGRDTFFVFVKDGRRHLLKTAVVLHLECLE